MHLKHNKSYLFSLSTSVFPHFPAHMKFISWSNIILMDDALKK